MADVFISYVERDGRIAQQLAEGLEAAGYSTWHYERDSLPGVRYLAQVSESIEHAQAMVLIISPDALDSDQVANELFHAYESRKPIIPLLRDISHPQFQQHKPDWRQALGAATSVRIPPGGVGEILPRIVAGLSALGVRPGGAVAKARPAGPPETRPAEKGGPGRRRPVPRWAAPVAALAILGLLAAGLAGGILWAVARSTRDPTSAPPSVWQTTVPATPLPTAEPAPTATAEPAPTATAWVVQITSAASRPTLRAPARRSTPPTVDGLIEEGEWDGASRYQLTFRTRAGGEHDAVLYLMHDGRSLFIGLDSGYAPGWDTRAHFYLDGNDNQSFDGSDSSWPVDLQFGISGPGGWPGYDYYKPMSSPELSGNLYDPPPFFQRASAVVRGTVHYEFEVPLAAIQAGAGDTIGLLLFNGGGPSEDLYGTYPDGSPDWNVRNWSRWAGLTLEP